MTFAVLGFNPDRIAALVVNSLAVGGGFLAGYALTLLATYLLDRWLTGGKSPVGLQRAVKMVGGVCGALLVLLLVFSAGGGGPGDGPGTTATTGTGSGPGTSEVAAKATDPATPPKPPEPPRTEEVVRVTVLSGADVVGEKFYVVEGHAEKLTLDEVKRVLAERKAATAKSLAVAVVLAARTDPDGSGVRSLIGMAQDAGYAVKLPQAK